MSDQVRVRKDHYQLFCGALTCSTRLAGRLHDVHIDDMPDGEIWLCPNCQKKEK